MGAVVTLVLWDVGITAFWLNIKLTLHEGKLLIP